MALPKIAAGTKVVLIAGPTASGKSRLAIELARRHDGVVVNADSMQVYAELRILTARPTMADEAEAPHRLYGHVPATTRYSAGVWLDDIARALTDADEKGLLPIVVGGTGLYFKGLTEGLAAIPPIPAEIRQRILSEADGVASSDLHRRLAEIDPQDATQIRPSDRSRIIRAMEVVVATGRPLGDWRAQPAIPLVDVSTVERIVLDPERAHLHERIAARAEAMMAAGAIDEAVRLGGLGLSDSLPAMKAIGVRQLMEHGAGDLSLEEALASIKTQTRRYAKRQMTWFRHQMKDWKRVGA